MCACVRQCAPPIASLNKYDRVHFSSTQVEQTSPAWSPCIFTYTVFLLVAGAKELHHLWELWVHVWVWYCVLLRCQSKFSDYFSLCCTAIPVSFSQGKVGQGNRCCFWHVLKWIPYSLSCNVSSWQKLYIQRTDMREWYQSSRLACKCWAIPTIPPSSQSVTNPFL